MGRSRHFHSQQRRSAFAASAKSWLIASLIGSLPIDRRFEAALDALKAATEDMATGSIVIPDETCLWHDGEEAKALYEWLRSECADFLSDDPGVW